MLKLKLRQNGIFKKFISINDNLIKIRNFPFSLKADRIIKTDKEKDNQKIQEKEFSENEKENEKNSKLNKAKFMLNNRRAINFLKEDQLAFRKKEEYLKKEEEINKINSIKEYSIENELDYENIYQNTRENSSEIIYHDEFNKIKENEKNNNYNQNLDLLNNKEKNFKSKIKISNNFSKFF